MRRELRQREPAGRHTAHDELPPVDHDVVDRGFEEIGREQPGLPEHVDGGAADGAAHELQRPRARCARAAFDDVGVALDDLDLGGGHREHFGNERSRTHGRAAARRTRCR